MLLLLHIFLFLLLGFAAFIIFLAVLAYILYGWPLVEHDKWSIGVYTGKSPFNLKPPRHIKNPVLTAKNVTDVRADFVADPFIIRENGTWYMFFEVFQLHNRKGLIGLATSKDGYKWEYQRIVMEESMHLSYPCVFQFQGQYYMIPECYCLGVNLYKATEFPTKWEKVKTLLNAKEVDATVFTHNNKWWMFTSVPRHEDLHLYYADDLFGEWHEHPCSPVIRKNKHIARPAGKVVTVDGRLIRFTQDDWFIYGTRVRAFEITKLTETEYEERLFQRKPVVGRTGGWGWNRNGMHTVNLCQIEADLWIAAVDGYGNPK